MGHRANLIIISDGNYELYYDHHCANSLDQCLFWGERYSVDFFRKHELQAKTAWLDTLWCEGGAIIDLDRKVLLFFGGEDILYKIPLREIYLQLLHHTWPGYKIRWAHNDIIDLAEYVGVPREEVINPASLKVGAPLKEETMLYTFSPVREAFTFQSRVLRPADEPNQEDNVETHFYPEKICLDETEGVCSLTQRDGSILFYSMESHGMGLEILLGGERLLECLKKSQPRKPESIIYSGGFPGCGIHIDLLKKELCFWWDSPLIEQDQLNDLWPGWKILPWEGNYTRQTEATNGKLQFPAKDIGQLLDSIEEIVCRNTADSLSSALQTVEVFTKNGFKVEINPDILSTENFDCPRQAKQIFSQVKNLYLQSAESAMRDENCPLKSESLWRAKV